MPDLLPLLLLLPHLAHVALAHGQLNEPAQRGLLRGNNLWPHPVDRNAPYDPYSHFPAGDKNSRPGAGKLSQERAVNFNWTPFDPTKSSFKWRAGVCGDPKGGSQDHMRGGQYYYDGKIVKTYNQGGILEAKISVVAHHNGFVELHVCNVKQCGGEISESCFRSGNCQKLIRTLEPSCESRDDKGCAPRDPKHPGRWFLPCASGKEIDVYGGSKMRFRLPENLSCDHCVLHWRWVGANGCNPPGVVEYFRGPRGPKWGNCPGQGGAIGGYTSVQKTCEGRSFAEEYYQCADIRILSRGGGRSDDRPQPEPQPEPEAQPKPAPSELKPSSPKPVTGNGNGGAIQYIVLVADEHVRRTLRGGTTYINTRDWNQLAFEAITDRLVSKMEFFVDGRKVWTDYHRPYFMMGNIGRKPNYWKTPIFNRTFKLQARAEGQVFSVNVRLTR